MADKRETKRDRRDAAKQRRLEELRRRQRKERLRKFWYAGIAAAVIAGIVLAVVFLGGGTDPKELHRIAAAGGCEDIQTKANEGNSHTPPYRYGTNPPTSGNHSGTVGLTGVLPTPIPDTYPDKDENLVHNMEHGHVILWYKPALDATVLDSLKSFVRKDTTRRVLIPREDMPYQVAFTAWTKLQGCSSPNAQTVKVAEAFAKEFQGKGPEGTGDAPGRPAPQQG